MPTLSQLSYRPTLGCPLPLPTAACEKRSAASVTHCLSRWCCRFRATAVRRDAKVCYHNTAQAMLTAVSTAYEHVRFSRLSATQG
jgi:hypothetical protein